ncbi:hypothetical protein GCM10025853_07820 [Tetragenococcus halophilus subsp. halophilus DSM 20339]|nr:hypothetical protein GCM10025853_07820 [Tetragenococcus halophilus subsp. halophilus DSM 20339]
MNRKKIFSFLTLLMTVFALSACKSESIADRDVLEVSEDSNEIIWG